MRRSLSFLLAAILLLGLTACGKGGDPSASGSAGSTGSAASTSQEDPNTTPEPEPYVISDPKVMPEGGSKDGRAPSPSPRSCRCADPARWGQSRIIWRRA